jgi:Smg protein
MFEVLVYVYENYWQGDACPELHRLGRKLTAAGFDAEEIQAALVWLDGLNVAAQGTQISLPAKARKTPATYPPQPTPSSRNPPAACVFIPSPSKPTWAHKAWVL